MILHSYLCQSAEKRDILHFDNFLKLFFHLPFQWRVVVIEISLQTELLFHSAKLFGKRQNICAWFEPKPYDTGQCKFYCPPLNIKEHFFFFFLVWKIPSEETNHHPKTTHCFWFCLWSDSKNRRVKFVMEFITSPPFGRRYSKESNFNPWTTESTLPQTDTSPSLSWNRGPKHKSAKQCHKQILHFDLSHKADIKEDY